MIQSSTAFGTTIENKSRTFHARFLVNSSVLACDIEKIVCTKGACSEQIVPGSVYVPYLEATLKSCSINLKGVELEYQVGLDVSNSTEYISLGFFTVSELTAASGEIRFTAVGRLGTIGNNAFVSQLTYPATLQSLLSELETFMGLTVTAKGLTVSGTITEAPAGPCRDVLGLIAGLLGGFVTEDNSGSVVIVKYGAGDTVSIAPYRSIEVPELNKTGYTVQGIKVIALEEQELSDGTIIPEVSYSYGNEITITQLNPFMTQALFNAMYPNIVGYTFTPGNVKIALGDPRLEPWDRVAVTDLDSNTWNVPCLELVHEFNGGFSTDVIANIASADTSAIQVKGAMTLEMERLRKGVYNASATAEQAIDDAAAAQTAVETVTQYFWHDSSGAHIKGGTGGYQNNLTSNGMALVDLSSGNPLAEFLINAVKFYTDAYGETASIEFHDPNTQAGEQIAKISYFRNDFTNLIFDAAQYWFNNDAINIGNYSLSQYINNLIASQTGGIKYKSGAINANSHTTVSYTRTAVIFMFRAVQSTSGTVALCDQWSGVVRVSSNANMTVSVSSKTATLTNGYNAYINYVVIYD